MALEIWFHVIVDVDATGIGFTCLVRPELLLFGSEGVPFLASDLEYVFWAAFRVVFAKLRPVVHDEAHVTGPLAYLALVYL